MLVPRHRELRQPSRCPTHLDRARIRGTSVRDRDPGQGDGLFQTFTLRRVRTGTPGASLRSRACDRARPALLSWGPPQQRVARSTAGLLARRAPIAAGKPISIEATAWLANTYWDRLDLYYTSTPSTPVWTYLGTLSSVAADTQILSMTFMLPSGTSTRSAASSAMPVRAAS